MVKNMPRETKVDSTISAFLRQRQVQYSGPLELPKGVQGYNKTRVGKFKLSGREILEWGADLLTFRLTIEADINRAE